jgi:RNA polymerase sigma-70 factor (ECF subfamily)
MDLASTYLSALDPAARANVEEGPLPAALEALCAAACSAVPGLAPHLGDFVRSLAARAADGRLPPLERAADLALAFASARGDPGALKALDALLTAVVPRAVARTGPSPAFTAQVAQEVRVRLLVGEQPRIADYAGLGPLAGWLRTCALRVALNLRRARSDLPKRALSSSVGAVVIDPELAMLRARYRDDFEAALRVALDRLPARERAALCLHVRDGMSSEKVAALFGVSRATAKRILVRARESVAAETRRELQGRLQLTTSEIDSVVRAVRSDIDTSVARLFTKVS